MKCKYSSVPSCKNTPKSAPNKLFYWIPEEQKKKQIWFLKNFLLFWCSYTDFSNNILSSSLKVFPFAQEKHNEWLALFATSCEWKIKKLLLTVDYRITIAIIYFDIELQVWMKNNNFIHLNAELGILNFFNIELIKQFFCYFNFTTSVFSLNYKRILFGVTSCGKNAPNGT